MPVCLLWTKQKSLWQTGEISPQDRQQNEFLIQILAVSCLIPWAALALHSLNALLCCGSHVFPSGQLLAALLFSVLLAPLWPGCGAGYGPDDLGCLLSGHLWSFCSPLTQINPLCLTRHILDLVKSMEGCSGGGGGGWWVLEPLWHLQKPWAGFIPGFSSVYQLLLLRSPIQREIRRVCRTKAELFSEDICDPKLPKIALHCLSLAGRAVLLLQHAPKSQPTLLCLNI